MNTYDLIIIGGGAGAFAAGIKANELGKQTLIVNGGLPAGGTCVNVGCVPSKILVHAGEVIHQAKNHGIPGIDIEVKNVDFKKVIEHELGMVEMFRDEKYTKVLKNLEHVTFVEGRASFTGEKEIVVDGEKYIAEKFVIATGSTANVPSIEGIREVGYVTHIEALALTEQPNEMVVIGAGPVGLELAQIYARFGTKVTILQRGERIFPHGESDLITQLHKVLEEEGITIHTKTEAKSVKIEDGKKVLTFSVDGQEQTITVDEILLASGKTANTAELNLEVVGVEVNDRKAVVVNEHFETNVPHVYAVGDVTNLPMRLETTAGHEGSLVAENIFTDKKNKIEYNEVPYAIFTDPGYASVGLTEDAQMERDGVCACRTVPFTSIPKAGIIGRTEGMIKMGIDPKTKVIVGVHILAPNAADLIAEAMVLIKNKNTIDDVLNSEPVFPTLSEVMKYVSLSFTKDLSQLSCCI
tara:strand:- start:1441 stop:2844 length:1404 start_codon:yes stop_codon:yes gene_type:complete